MLDTIFPVKTQLKILQLEGYDPFRFIQWIFKHLFIRSLSEKRKIVYTFKLKSIIAFSTLSYFGVLAVTYLVSHNLFIVIALSFILATQPYIFLFFSQFLFMLPEFLYSEYIIFKTKKKIHSLKKLTVIAITGSYGKSSTKEISYQLLKSKYKVLRTPESYNTILGISKVVDYELDESYDFFICEIAAYHKGDIKRLCRMVQPNIGILTGITTQHLERFGSLQKITQTKFELFDSVKSKDKVIFNLGDKNISNEVKRRGIKNPTGYVNISNCSFTKNGSIFDIKYNNQIKKANCQLFGFSNIINLSGSIALALLLRLDLNTIVGLIKTIKQSEHRFELKPYGDSMLIDNTFSSNKVSFEEMLKTAKTLNGTKALVTPGIIEQGNTETNIHKYLGKLSQNIFTKVIMVGHNKRTRAFAESIKDVIFIKDDRVEYLKTVENIKNKIDWIFLENDLTENY